MLEFYRLFWRSLSCRRRRMSYRFWTRVRSACEPWRDRSAVGGAPETLMGPSIRNQP